MCHLILRRPFTVVLFAWTLWQFTNYPPGVPDDDDLKVVGHYPSHYECEVARYAAMRKFPLWHPITKAELRRGTVVLSDGCRVNWVCGGGDPSPMLTMERGGEE